MQLSTKTTYGLRALLDIALNSGKEPVLLREIAKRQDISASYLEQIIISLQAAGLTRSVRGRNGGFFITKNPSEITLFEIMRSMERTLVFAACVDNPGICSRIELCAAHDIWCRLSDILIRELKSITLEDVIKLHTRKKLIKETGEKKRELVPDLV